MKAKELNNASRAALCVWILVCATAHSQTVVTEFEYNTSSANAGDFQSPVTTYNGCIYGVFIAPDARTMVVKKDVDGTMTTGVAFATTTLDNWHNTSSVGIDKDGYIHVAGNMHSNDWRMRVSERPEDVTSFVSEPSTPDGNLITYPYFIRDRNGELYLTNRSHACRGGGMVNVYDPQTKTWRALGAIPSGGCVPFVLHQYPVHSYTSYKTRIFFDVANRMHLSTAIWTIYGNPDGRAANATHVLYTYSDDGGETFKKADGSSIASLPVTIENGTVVHQEDPGTIYNKNDVGALPDGTPLVTYRNSGGSHLAIRQSDGFWRQIAQANNVIVDDNGVITYLGGGNINRSSDGGNTWQSISAPVSGALFDGEYTTRTGNLRYSTWSGNVFAVHTVLVSSDPVFSLSPSELSIVAQDRPRSVRTVCYTLEGRMLSPVQARSVAGVMIRTQTGRSGVSAGRVTGKLRQW